MHVFVTINDAGMKINAGLNELIDKGVCNKGFIWNPSNCECECNKSCDVGEYLDCSNCKCRKKSFDKLVEECTEIIDEAEITEITQAENEHKNKCSSCTLYIVLFSIFFTILIGIGIFFVYYKYMSRNKENVSKYDCTYQAKNY